MIVGCSLIKLFENIKTKNLNVKQIDFTGTLSATLGTKLFYCTYGTDRELYRKTNQLKWKFSVKILLQCLI